MFLEIRIVASYRRSTEIIYHDKKNYTITGNELRCVIPAPEPNHWPQISSASNLSYFTEEKKAVSYILVFTKSNFVLLLSPNVFIILIFVFFRKNET